jgi:SAM-dependent methyltransferase
MNVTVDDGSTSRTEAYGERGLSLVDRFGVYLSKRAVMRELRSTQSAVVIDLGCGYDALVLRALASSIESGIGIDLRISPEANAVPRLRFVEGSIEEALPLEPDATGDLVLAINVLEHLWDPATILRESARVLRAGGKLLVNVPTWQGKRFLELSAFRLGLSPRCEMDDHKMYYSKRDLWPLMVRAGFLPSDIQMRYHKGGLNLFAVARKASVSRDD